MYEDPAADPVGVLPPPPTSPPTVGRRPRRAWAWWLGGSVFVLVLVALVAAAFIRVPYVIISPGEATALDQRVLQVGDASSDDPGHFLYLTVSVSNRDPNLYRYLFARLDPDASVQRKERLIGCAGYDESLRLGQEQMGQSQDAAKAAAMRRLGHEVGVERQQTLVIDVQCDGPSMGRIELGDVIVAVDGTPVTAADDVRPLVVAHQPGDVARFTVERAGERRDVLVRLGSRDGEAFAGILTQTDRRHQFPIDVEIDTARVSGPSAGLAFSLAIIDELTPGSVTGGRDVAVTGTISEDGAVGPVGGVAQKAVTAREAGARLMIVPRDEVREARNHAGGMKVVGVATLDDALRTLARAGGAPVAASPIAAPSTAAQ
ncbi:MAG: hypothetical protein AMXMBFR46_27670 [Acidimicrobiia bacterium]